jgi:hypothetical protein
MARLSRNVMSVVVADIVTIAVPLILTQLQA